MVDYWFENKQINKQHNVVTELLLHYCRKNIQIPLHVVNKWAHLVWKSQVSTSWCNGLNIKSVKTQWGYYDSAEKRKEGEEEKNRHSARKRTREGDARIVHLNVTKQLFFFIFFLIFFCDTMWPTESAPETTASQSAGGSAVGLPAWLRGWTGSCSSNCWTKPLVNLETAQRCLIGARFYKTYRTRCLSCCDLELPRKLLTAANNKHC